MKVKHPTLGDEIREWDTPFDGEFSTYFLSMSKNKKLILGR